jgi:hypothetical protein
MNVVGLLKKAHLTLGGFLDGSSFSKLLCNAGKPLFIASAWAFTLRDIASELDGGASGTPNWLQISSFIDSLTDGQSTNSSKTAGLLLRIARLNLKRVTYG